jgi:signal transduction histidine kinase
MADLIVDGASDSEVQAIYGRRCRKSRLIEGAYEAVLKFPELGEEGRWLRFTASPIKDDDGYIIGAIETLEDVTRRVTATENLRYYLNAMTQAQEDERKRIARELHDDTVQLLGSLSRQLDSFLRTERGLKPEQAAFLKDMQGQLNAGAQSVHRFSQALRLSVLDDLGLIPALRSLVNGLHDRYGVKAELVVRGEAKRLTPEVETALFRIVQEAINNIGKHARASLATVTVEFGKGTVGLTVTDDGKGFDLTGSIEALPRAGKLGLAGMRERVRLLGGTFDLSSAEGKGTRLTASVPVTLGEDAGRS